MKENWIKDEIIKCYNENFKRKTAFELFYMKDNAISEIFKDELNSHFDHLDEQLEFFINQETLLAHFKTEDLDKNLYIALLDKLILETEILLKYSFIEQDHLDKKDNIKRLFIYRYLDRSKDTKLIHLFSRHSTNTNELRKLNFSLSNYQICSIKEIIGNRKEVEYMLEIIIKQENYENLKKELETKRDYYTIEDIVYDNISSILMSQRVLFMG